MLSATHGQQITWIYTCADQKADLTRGLKKQQQTYNTSENNKIYVRRLVKTQLIHIVQLANRIFKDVKITPEKMLNVKKTKLR